MPQWAIMAGLTGASALGGALANRGQKSTQTPTLSPEMAPLQSDLISRIMARMSDPSAGTEPLKLGLKSSVNQRFSTLPQRLTTSLAKRGFADSGQLGQGFKGLELARMQELGDVDTEIAKLILGREDQTMDLANRLLSAGRGVSTATSGNMLGGAIGAGTETLTTLMAMQKMFGGGSGAVV
jgi:hypothetical protein